jgi:hypothetical protein
VPTFLQELHGGVIGRHLSSNIILRKILDAKYWWPTINLDVHEYCGTYDQCQKTSNMLKQNLAKLVTNLPKQPFQKWWSDFFGLVKLASIMSSNQYILVAIDYATKWVEAQAFHTNIVAITAKFLYKHILLRFGCPLIIITDQGTHFINDLIRYLTNHFILKHTNYNVYYPQGNGHVEFTNKVFGTLLTN